MNLHGFQVLMIIFIFQVVILCESSDSLIDWDLDDNKFSTQRILRHPIGINRHQYHRTPHEQMTVFQLEEKILQQCATRFINKNGVSDLDENARQRFEEVKQQIEQSRANNGDFKEPSLDEMKEQIENKINIIKQPSVGDNFDVNNQIQKINQQSDDQRDINLKQKNFDSVRLNSNTQICENPENFRWYYKILFNLIQMCPNPQETQLQNSLNQNPETIEKSIETILDEVQFPQLNWNQIDSTNWENQMIGKSFLSNIYISKLLKTNRDVAVQVYTNPQNNTVGIILRELRTNFAFEHPNKVEFFGFGVHDGKVFLVFELGQRRGIWQEFGTNQMYQEESNRSILFTTFNHEIIVMLYRLTQSMDKLHKLGILHRNIGINTVQIFKLKKPQKVEFFKDGSLVNQVYLGYEFQISEFTLSASEQDQFSIQPGNIRNYAPEATKDFRKYSFASDVYSFGAFMYEVFHQSSLYPKTDFKDVQVKIQRHQLSSFHIALDENIQQIILKCWNKIEKQRPTFLQLSALLYEYLTTKGNNKQ